MVLISNQAKVIYSAIDQKDAAQLTQLNCYIGASATVETLVKFYLSMNLENDEGSYCARLAMEFFIDPGELSIAPIKENVIQEMARLTLPYFIAELQLLLKDPLHYRVALKALTPGNIVRYFEE